MTCFTFRTQRLNVGRKWFFFIFYFIFSYDMDRWFFKKNQLERALEVGFFSTFVIFIFHGPIRTCFWPRGHVPRGCSANKNWRSWKADMFLGTKILKIGQNFPNYSMHDPYSMKNKNNKSWKESYFQGPFQLVFFEKSSVHIIKKLKRKNYFLPTLSF